MVSDYDDFVECVSVMEMTSDTDTIGRLFRALIPSQIHQNCKSDTTKMSDILAY